MSTKNALSCVSLVIISVPIDFEIILALSLAIGFYHLRICLSDKENSENIVELIRNNNLRPSEIECDIAGDSIMFLQSLLKTEQIEKSLEKIECIIFDKNAFNKLLSTLTFEQLCCWCSWCC